MRKERTLFFIGVLVVVLPFLGFTQNGKIGFSLLLGGSIIYLAYLFRKENLDRNVGIKTDEVVMEVFVDNIEENIGQQ